ncbi:MAG: DUF4340 domain-containing protein [Candidatus Zixiibacteriota bacterium]|nr:MAG: DUF4340 domain-containing protein [candidate division Zixibacteria bacterium]
MSETRRTILFAATAVGLAIIAYLVAPSPITPEAFLDQGELFFPDFTDPNAATTLEVIDYDQATGAARPFKVTFKNGQWTIPSHHDYPADAKDRLAQTAAGVIDIRKDDFRTDNVSDHEACGVVDPLDESAAGLSGRGKRVTLRGSGGSVLADFIIGNDVSSREGLKFVRVPGRNRVYAARVDVDISTRFEDWINKDLLELGETDIQELVLKDYSINERTLSVEQRDNLVLRRDGDQWTTPGLPSSRVVDSSAIKDLLTTVDELAVAGVRPKPAGLSSSLQAEGGENAISRADQMSLQRKGYYLSRNGQLLSNEGELQVLTKDGIRYTLRFGEVLIGSGLAVTAGTTEDSPEEQGQSENRYLFMTADFDSTPLGTQPPAPADENFRSVPDSLWTDEDRSNKSRADALDQWNRRADNGRELAANLNSRFAHWYYVISGRDFEKLDLGRSDLIVAKEDQTTGD